MVVNLFLACDTSVEICWDYFWEHLDFWCEGEDIVGTVRSLPSQLRMQKQCPELQQPYGLYEAPRMRISDNTLGWQSGKRKGLYLRGLSKQLNESQELLNFRSEQLLFVYRVFWLLQQKTFITKTHMGTGALSGRALSNIYHVYKEYCTGMYTAILLVMTQTRNHLSIQQLEKGSINLASSHYRILCSKVKQ